MPPSVAGGGARFGGNNGGGMERRHSLPLVNLDPESIGAKSNGFAGMGGARSLATVTEDSANNGSSGGSEVFGRPRSGDDLEKLVVSMTTRGMQQALTYGLRNTFAVLLRKKVGIDNKKVGVFVVCMTDHWCSSLAGGYLGKLW